MSGREAYLERDTKESKVKVYWNLDDIRREDRTSVFDSERKKEIILPSPDVIFIMNDRPYQELVRRIDSEIREGRLLNRDEYAAIFGQYFWAAHFPHWYDQLARHGKYDLRIYVEGKSNDRLPHHSIVEDTSIVLGQVLDKALGDKRGIRRFGSGVGLQEGVRTQMDVDISGRIRASLRTGIRDYNLQQMMQHTAYSFANNARLTMTGMVTVLDKSIEEEHHKGESIFKGLALALSQATAFDERNPEYVASTKEKLD